MTKVSGKVEGTKGSLLPVKPGLWYDAASKLEEAHQAIAAMRGPTDRIEYEGAWTQFVDSLEEFWVRFFDEGKDKFSKFQPWAGSYIALRKKGLLAYLYQSRHKSQHGRLKLDWTDGRLQIGPEFFGGINMLQLQGDGKFDAGVFATSQNDLKVVEHYGDPQLPKIGNRGEEFVPPEEFDSQSLKGLKPDEVAQIAWIYYLAVLQLAFKKFNG